jgi:tyrosyl-tRNA synthetase
MSKSKNNYIGVDEKPEEMYGKAMSIPDELMEKYFHLATSLPLAEKRSIQERLEVGSLHPRDAKMQLARTIVSMYHGHEAAEKAEDHFKSVFQQGSIPEDMPVLTWDGGDEPDLLELLMFAGFFPSKSEARRMVQNGGIRLNGEKIDDVNMKVPVQDELILQVGKRKFVRILRKE